MQVAEGRFAKPHNRCLSAFPNFLFPFVRIFRARRLVPKRRTLLRDRKTRASNSPSNCTIRFAARKARDPRGRAETATNRWDPYVSRFRAENTLDSGRNCLREGNRRKPVPQRARIIFRESGEGLNVPRRLGDRGWLSFIGTIGERVGRLNGNKKGKNRKQKKNERERRAPFVPRVYCIVRSSELHATGTGSLISSVSVSFRKPSAPDKAARV